MERYIDAEKLEKEGWSASRTYQQDAHTMVYETKKMTDFPSADVVEVVRCKDCKYHDDIDTHGTVYCPNLIGGWVSERFFCAGGERREDE